MIIFSYDAAAAAAVATKNLMDGFGLELSYSVTELVHLKKADDDDGSRKCEEKLFNQIFLLVSFGKWHPVMAAVHPDSVSL